MKDKTHNGEEESKPKGAKNGVQGPGGPIAKPKPTLLVVFLIRIEPDKRLTVARRDGTAIMVPSGGKSNKLCQAARTYHRRNHWSRHKFFKKLRIVPTKYF